MFPSSKGRRALLGLGLLLPFSGVRAAVPPRPALAALSQPAVMTPGSVHAAMLAVGRAGRRIVMAGERGIVLLSDDDGHSWVQAQVPVRSSIVSVQFTDERQGWAAGHLGVVLHTQDGGHTWTRQLDGPTAIELFAAAAKSQPADLDTGRRKWVDMLVDDGPDKPWLGMQFESGGRGIVVGAYNLALSTKDGGTTWEPLSFRLPNPHGLHLYGVGRRAGTILIAGEQGLLMRSDDDGRSYSVQPSSYKGSLFGVLPVSDDTWIVYGLRGNAFVSRDRGRSWQALALDFTVSVSSARRAADGRIWLVSQAGELALFDPVSNSVKRVPAAFGAPVADLVETVDGGLVGATLRGPVRVSIAASAR